MTDADALQVLRRRQKVVASSVPLDLVERIYQIEEWVQFDDQRPEAATKIRQAIQAELEKEALRGATGDDNHH